MASNPATPSSSSFQIPQHILDDLCSRFIINIPEEERQDLIRVFFQIELAHWFYLDFYCQDNNDLKARGIKDFSAQIFRHCPTLIQYADNVEHIHGTWREYKMAVPTYGAILLDPSLQFCLLVQGYWSKTSWGFPKGKVNEDEPADSCAIREVFEETGFDISKLIDRDEYIEYKMSEQLSRLYLVPGVSRETTFAPRTRKEIKKLEWFKIDSLPAHKKDTICKNEFGLPPNAFFMVIPFVKPMRKWINKRLGKSERRTPRSRETSSTPKASKDHSISQETTTAAEKQRQKQQQLFAQQNQSNYMEYIRYKEKGKGKGVSPTPSKNNKAQRPAASPRSGKGKQNLQILKRDGTVAGTSSNPKKSLEPYFEENTPQNQRKYPNSTFYPEAWKNFKLDYNKIMACFNG